MNLCVHKQCLQSKEANMLKLKSFVLVVIWKCKYFQNITQFVMTTHHSTYILFQTGHVFLKCYQPKPNEKSLLQHSLPLVANWLPQLPSQEVHWPRAGNIHVGIDFHSAWSWLEFSCLLPDTFSSNGSRKTGLPELRHGVRKVRICATSTTIEEGQSFHCSYASPG